MGVIQMNGKNVYAKEQVTYLFSNFYREIEYIELDYKYLISYYSFLFRDFISEFRN